MAESLNDIVGKELIIRTHGVGPEIFENAKKLGLNITDATCPFVEKAQMIAEKRAKEGFQVIIVGDKKHPEVDGIYKWSGKTAEVVENLEQAKKLSAYPKVAILAQTTQTSATFAEITKYFETLEKEQKINEMLIYDTICSATARRQEATAALAERMAFMIIIGGKNSANTLKLVQICQAKNVPTMHVEGAAEIDLTLLKNKAPIGVSAGASTPDWIIEEVLCKMAEQDKDLQTENEETKVGGTAVHKDNDQDEECTIEYKVVNETVVKETDCPDDEGEPQKDYTMLNESVVEDTEQEEEKEDPQGEVCTTEYSVVDEHVIKETTCTDGETPDDKQEEELSFAEQYDHDIKEIRSGARVKGVVVQLNDEEILVDIGGKSEGVLPSAELLPNEAENIQEHYKVGDEIEVLILKKENKEGYPVLSKKRVDQEKVWENLAEKKTNKETVSGKVVDVVKGGLLVDVGIRGFVPASLVSLSFVEDLSTLVGQELDMKVIECERSRNKLVLSAKAVLLEEREKEKEKTLAELEEGQTRDGVVRRLTSFGAFVDIGGLDGLLHVSEMAWYRVDKPSDILKEGEEIQVYILNVDDDKERISLGLKQLIENPWNDAAEKYPEGETINAKVMRLAPFGAFLQVEPGVEGLVHISQLAHERVEKPEDVVNPGDEVEVKVLSVDPEKKRMSLSIKETLPAPKKVEKPAEAKRAERPITKTIKPPKQKNEFAALESEEIGTSLGDLMKKAQAEAEAKKDQE